MDELTKRYRAHELRRRAENRGNGILMSLSLHQEHRAENARSRRARAYDAVESDLRRIERAAAECCRLA